MDEREKERLIKEWEALLQTYYALGYKRFRYALNQSIHPVLDLIKSTNSSLMAQGMSSQLISEVPISKAIRDFNYYVSDRTARYLYKTYLKFIPEEANLGIGFGSDKFKYEMGQYMANEGAEHIRKITETTRERVRKAFIDGAREEDTLAKLRKRIVDYTQGGLDGRINRRARAMLIARTETLMSTAKAKELQFESYQVELEKEWIHDHPKVPRESHLAVNGKVVDKEDSFIVGGVKMRYAGDPRGGISNNANCRCSTIYKPKLDKDGNVIWKS
jgi:hypothetical protein